MADLASVELVSPASALSAMASGAFDDTEAIDLVSVVEESRSLPIIRDTYEDQCTVYLQHEPLPGKTAEYELWLNGIGAAARTFPGWLGRTVIRPKLGQATWITMFRFDSYETLHAWVTSPIRQEIVAQKKHYCVENSFVQEVVQGSVPIFDLSLDGHAEASMAPRHHASEAFPPTPHAHPPKYLTTLIVWLALQCTLQPIKFVVKPHLIAAHIAPALGVLCVLLVVVPLMTYISVPATSVLIKRLGGLRCCRANRRPPPPRPPMVEDRGCWDAEPWVSLNKGLVCFRADDAPPPFYEPLRQAEDHIVLLEDRIGDLEQLVKNELRRVAHRLERPDLAVGVPGGRQPGQATAQLVSDGAVNSASFNGSGDLSATAATAETKRGDGGDGGDGSDSGDRGDRGDGGDGGHTEARGCTDVTKCTENPDTGVTFLRRHRVRRNKLKEYETWVTDLSRRTYLFFQGYQGVSLLRPRAAGARLNKSPTPPTRASQAAATTAAAAAVAAVAAARKPPSAAPAQPLAPSETETAAAVVSPQGPRHDDDDDCYVLIAKFLQYENMEAWIQSSLFQSCMRELQPLLRRTLDDDASLEADHLDSVVKGIVETDALTDLFFGHQSSTLTDLFWTETTPPEQQLADDTDAGTTRTRNRAADDENKGQSTGSSAGSTRRSRLSAKKALRKARRVVKAPPKWKVREREREREAEAETEIDRESENRTKTKTKTEIERQRECTDA